jgi:hypothetical protein
MDSKMRQYLVAAFASIALFNTAFADEPVDASDSAIAEQRAALASSADGVGFGPQSPRDISVTTGSNPRVFGAAPAYTQMNLCNIHFHENAEHRGGEFTTYAGNGDGHGYRTGYKYDGELTAAERAPLDHKVGVSEHGES